MITHPYRSIEQWQRRRTDRKYPPTPTGEIFLEEWAATNTMAHRATTICPKEYSQFPAEVEKLREKYIGANIVAIVSPDLSRQERKANIFQSGHYIRVCGKLGLLRQTAQPLVGDYNDMVIPKADVERIRHWDTQVGRTDDTGWILGRATVAQGVIEGFSVRRNTLLISDAEHSRGFILPVLRGGSESDASQTPAIRISELALPAKQIYSSDYLANR